MNLSRTLSFAVLFTASSAFATDPGLLNLVMPDAKVVIGLDVEHTRDTILGRFLLSQMPAEDKNFQSFMAMTGFDPRRDLSELVFASSDTLGGKTTHGVVLIRGAFDMGRISSLLQVVPQGKVTTYQGFDIITSGKDPGGLAILDQNIAVAGDLANVQAAIDRRKSNGAADAAMAAKVQRLSSANDIWFLTTIPVSDMADSVSSARMSGAMKGDVLKGIQEASGGLHFGASNVEISAEAVAGTEKDATALADVLRFLANMVQLNRDNKEAAGLATLVDNLQLKAEARTVRMTVAVPEEEIQKLIESAKPRVKKISTR